MAEDLNHKFSGIFPDTTPSPAKFDPHTWPFELIRSQVRGLTDGIIVLLDYVYNHISNRQPHTCVSVDYFIARGSHLKESKHIIGNLVIFKRPEPSRRNAFWQSIGRILYVNCYSGPYWTEDLKTFLEATTGLLPREFQLKLDHTQIVESSFLKLRVGPGVGPFGEEDPYLLNALKSAKGIRVWTLCTAESLYFTSLHTVLMSKNDSELGMEVGKLGRRSALSFRLPKIPNYGEVYFQKAENLREDSMLNNYVDGQTKTDSEVPVFIDLERSIVALYTLVELVVCYIPADYSWYLSFLGKALDPVFQMKLSDCGITWGSAITMVIQEVKNTQELQNSVDARPAVINEDVKADNSTTFSRAATIKTFFTGRSSFSGTFFSAQSRFSKDGPKLRARPTGFLKTISERGLMPKIEEELDWSGRGQHVEYGPTDEPPLEVGPVLGWSANAIVTEVKCRRIKLARKCIPCKRLSLEDSLWEVAHLQKLAHPHVVRLIGSYVHQNSLNILIYPVAEYNLKEFMQNAGQELSATHRGFLFWSIPCLKNAVDYIHGQTIRHMDIKPTIKQWNDLPNRWHILLADFDVATDFKCSAAEHTNTNRRFTELYASPEAADGDYKGRASDFFSLGCVFLEMVTVVCSRSLQSFEEQRKDAYGHGAYYLNIQFCQDWLNKTILPCINGQPLDFYGEIHNYFCVINAEKTFDIAGLGRIPRYIAIMLTEDPIERWRQLIDSETRFTPALLGLVNDCCAKGPMPLANAE